MSTHFKEKVEKIEQTIAELTEEGAKGKPIVVEGTKDARALQELGVNGAFLTVKTGGKSFLQAVMEIETLNPSEIILLLDFDRRGKEGTRRLQRDLERTGVKLNVRFWQDLQALVGREVQSIESLTNYLRTLREKAQEQ